MSERSLWYGALGAVSAWMLHFLVVVAYGSVVCIGAVGTVPRFGLDWWVLLAVTAVALVVAVTSTAMAARNLRRLGAASGATVRTTEVPAARPVFMAFSGLLLGGMFLLALAFSTIALFLVPLCA